MKNIDFFKLQAKTLLREFNAKKQSLNEGKEYTPRFFYDLDDIIYDYKLKFNEDFTLMKAQHIVSQLAGFYKWNELIQSTEEKLELEKLLFISRSDTLMVDDWRNYESEYLKNFDDTSKLKIFKERYPAEEIVINNNSVKMKLIYEDHEKEQDMIRTIMDDKKISAKKAITSSITESNCIRILETGWGKIALPIWGHADPYREMKKLENPIVNISLSQKKMRLVNLIMEKEKVSMKEAISFFILFNLESMGYHI